MKTTMHFDSHRMTPHLMTQHVIPASSVRAWQHVRREIDALFNLMNGDLRSFMCEVDHTHPFSEAHALFGEIDMPRVEDFVEVVKYGFFIGAIQRTARIIEHGRALGWSWDENVTQPMIEADWILRNADFVDERVARQLDSAARVLARHRLRAELEQCVTLVEGVWCAVTYQLRLPVDYEFTHTMNRELVIEDIEAENTLDNAFSARFKGARS